VTLGWEEQAQKVSRRDRTQDDPAARAAPNVDRSRLNCRGRCRQSRDLHFEAQGRSGAHCQGGKEREVQNGRQLSYRKLAAGLYPTVGALRLYRRRQSGLGHDPKNRTFQAEGRGFSPLEGGLEGGR
jgi:hypothetical protein